MSSHFTEQSNVARARQLSWSKRSKIRASFDEAYTHSLIQMGWFEARGGLPSTGQGPRKYHFLDLQAANPSPARGPERWMGMLQLVPKMAEAQAWQGVAQLELYGVEENFARAPAGQTTEALRVTGCRFFIPPMRNALSAPQCATARQVPPSTPRNRDTPMEPMPCAHV
jgi:hypothetical protein